MKKGYRGYKSYRPKKDKLYVNRENTLMDCWRFDTAYKKLDGFNVYRKWACGEGPVVRHLCSDKRCINPLHLVRGTDFENAFDENEVKFYVIIPRATIQLKDKYGFRYMKETINYGRERFRARFVEGLISSVSNVERLTAAKALFDALKVRTDIEITPIIGGI